MKRIDLRKVYGYYKEELFGEDDFDEDEGGYFDLENENKLFGVDDEAKLDEQSGDYMVGIPDDYPAILALRFVLLMEKKELKRKIKKRRLYRKEYGLLENPKVDIKSDDEILGYLRLMVDIGDIEGLHKAIENLIENGKMTGYFFTRVLVEYLKWRYFDSELVAKLCVNMLPTMNEMIYEVDDWEAYYDEFGSEDITIDDINKCRSEANQEFLGFLGASFEGMPDHQIADRYTEIIKKKLAEMDLA